MQFWAFETTGGSTLSFHPTALNYTCICMSHDFNLHVFFTSYLLHIT